jgi:hypothetical protein
MGGAVSRPEPGRAAWPQLSSTSSSTSGLVLAIDPTQSRASYAVEETFLNQSSRLATTVGQTRQIKGWLRPKVDDPTRSEFGIFSVDVSTLQNDCRRWDEALCGAWTKSRVRWARPRPSSSGCTAT